jgi:hypothetical protein
MDMAGQGMSHVNDNIPMLKASPSADVFHTSDVVQCCSSTQGMGNSCSHACGLLKCKGGALFGQCCAADTTRCCRVSSCSSVCTVLGIHRLAGKPCCKLKKLHPPLFTVVTLMLGSTACAVT